MPFTQAQVDRIDQWLQERAPGLRCGACGTSIVVPQGERAFRASAGEIGNEFGGIPIVSIEGKQIRFHASGAPVVSIACQACGHIMLFSPIIMALLPSTRV